MLSLQTSDSWAAAQVTIQVGVNVDVWVGSSSLPSAVDALNDLTDWANDVARAWWGVALFDWSWERQVSTGGALLVLRNNGGVFDFTPNATALALLGIPAAAAALEAVGTAAAAGTWAPGPTGYLALKLGVPWLKGGGQASAVGAVRSGVPGLAAWVAICRPVAGAQDTARLAELLGSASHPRRAWLRLSNVQRSSENVAPPDLQGWKLVALGTVQRNRAGASLWQHDLAVAGEAV
jgi:hypothetical protein